MTLVGIRGNTILMKKLDVEKCNVEWEVVSIPACTVKEKGSDSIGFDGSFK